MSRPVILSMPFMQSYMLGLAVGKGASRNAMTNLLAPQSILEAFALLIEPIFEQVYLKNSQIAWLSQARDRLLPKLMSGELEV